MLSILKDLSISSIYLPCFIALVGIVIKQKHFRMQSLVLVLFFYLLVERNYMNFAAQTINQKTIPLLPYFLAAEVALIYHLFKSSLSFGYFIGVLVVLVTIIIEATVFDSASMIVSKIIEPSYISAVCVGWLWSTFSMKERKIEKLPMFWVAFAFMIYFVPVIFLFPVEYGFIQIEWADQLFTIQVRWVINIISKIIISIAIWKELKS